MLRGSGLRDAVASGSGFGSPTTGATLRSPILPADTRSPLFSQHSHIWQEPKSTYFRARAIRP